MNHRQGLIVFLLLLASVCACSQTNFFHDFTLVKNFTSKNAKVAYFISPEWIHIYDDVTWENISVSLQAKRLLGNWEAGGGLGTYYTVDKSLSNNLELRPYLLLALKTPITESVLFTQTLKPELRTFMYSDQQYNSTTIRIRYALNLGYVFARNETRSSSWQISPYTEWFVVKNSRVKERFVGSQTYKLTLYRNFKNNQSVGLAYKYEKFNRNFYADKPNGHTMRLEYNF